jgi:hypothetical protein
MPSSPLRKIFHCAAEALTYPTSIFEPQSSLYPPPPRYLTTSLIIQHGSLKISNLFLSDHRRKLHAISCFESLRLSNHTYPHYRFPLSSLGHPQKTLADEALESFGVTIPLLGFYGVHSQCNSFDEGSHETAGEESPPDEDEDEDEDGEVRDDDDTTTITPNRILNLQRTDGKPILKYHPYIITR